MTPVLYKYLRRQHATELSDKGLLRVGTLYGFRKDESFGREITDPWEGKTALYAKESVVDWERPETIGPLVRRFFNIPAGSTGVMTNIRLKLTEQSEDVYVLCLSTTADPVVMERMGYDACVAITNVAEFLRLLTGHL